MRNANLDPSVKAGGLGYAVGAYVIWGLLPAYFMLLSHVAPVEVVAQRVLWSVPLLLLVIAARNQWAELRLAITTPSILSRLAASATLIALNWLVYIWAIHAQQVLATSIAYYLNPLINVVLARFFLGERLRPLQWVAVAIAATAVVLLALGALGSLWISIALAGTFAFYGLIRKVTPVGSVPGLTIETGLMFPIAAVALAFAAQLPMVFGEGFQSAFGRDGWTSFLMVFCGVITAVPLLLFAVAARRMSYITLGFVQYIGPTMAFLIGLFLFKEPLGLAKAGSFALIWLGVAVFSYDSWCNWRAGRIIAPA